MADLSKEMSDTIQEASFLVEGPSNEFNKKLIRRMHEWCLSVARLEEQIKSQDDSLSQEANSRLCYCAFEDEMMGKVPEGSFCSFCGWRRYESVINRINELEVKND